MVKVEDIVDRDSLEAWLDTRSREDAVLVAVRAAARVMPLWAEFCETDRARERDLTPLPVLRSLLTTRVAACVSTRVVTDANAAAATNATADFAINAATYAAAYAAATADFAINAATYAAAAANAAAYAASAAIWRAIWQDCEMLETGWPDQDPPLWTAPNDFTEIWQDIRPNWTTPGSPYVFWVGWYDNLLDPNTYPPIPQDTRVKIAEIPNEEWTKGETGKEAAQNIARLIDGILSGEPNIEVNSEARTPLSNAYPVDFSFDDMARIMRMVGIDDDTAHLRDPLVVQSFVDDCTELREIFQDFCDYAKEATRDKNSVGILRISAEKVLAELTLTNEKTHLQARHLVRLASHLEAFSLEENARQELGPTLAGILDDGVVMLKTTTRRHFGPAYSALAPLSQLSLDQIDQDAVLNLFDEVILRFQSLPDNQLIALDDDGLNVLSDMMRELRDFKGAIAEANSDEFRKILERRFAEGFGGTGLTFGRFIERSSQAVNSVGSAADQAGKTFKRVKTASDIFEFIEAFLKGGTG